jgi:hypothetical protein
LTVTTDAISPPSLHKELESKEIHITATRKILPKIAKKSLQGLLRKNSLQRLLQEELLARNAARRILCKYCCKKNSLQGLLQEGFFANLLQGLPSLWMQPKNQSQHHAGKSNSVLLWYKNTDTDIERETEKDRVVDKHIHARIVGDGEGCRGDWNHTRKAAAGHQFALAPLSPMCLYMYTAARRGRWLRQLQ